MAEIKKSNMEMYFRTIFVDSRAKILIWSFFSTFDSFTSNSSYFLIRLTALDR